MPGCREQALGRRNFDEPSSVHDPHSIGDLGEKTDQLIALANDAGGEDNITVMLVTVEGGGTGRLWHRIKHRWFLKAS